MVDFVEWCGRNHFLLNVRKTWESDWLQEVQLHGPCVSWGRMLVVWRSTSTHRHYSTGWTEVDQQRQYTRRGSAFLRKLRSFSFSSRMMESFYQSAVAGAVYLAVVCWENSSRAGNTNRMNKLIRKSSSLTGCKLDFQWRRGMCVCSVVLASLLDRITRMFSMTKRRSSFYTSQQPSWTGIAVNT